MTDTELLDWMADDITIEGFGCVDEDIHEIAIKLADAEQEWSEPEQRHYRAALRELIRRAAQQQPASDDDQAA